MFTKHFFKSLIIFIGMISLGLLGVFLVSYFDVDNPDSENSASVLEE